MLKLSKCSTVQPALGGPGQIGRLDNMTSKGPFQHQPVCDLLGFSEFGVVHAILNYYKVE